MDRIEAWANGPVCPNLYNRHRGEFIVSDAGGNSANLSSEEKQDIDRVVDFYGGFSGQQLSDITHSEEPWRRARRGLAPSERGTNEITLEAMTEYYGSLQKSAK